MDRERVARELVMVARELVGRIVHNDRRRAIEEIAYRHFDRGRIVHNDRDKATRDIMYRYDIDWDEADELLDDAEEFLENEGS